MSDELRIVLLGPPGSGKGTQAERLRDRHDLPWISTGELLREAVASGTDLGERVKGILAQGALVDDDTMADLVRGRLAQTDVAGGFLLDGYPRTEGQAVTLSEILGAMNESLSCVLFIDVQEEELVKRALARKRADDKEEVIRHRISVYREKTSPLIEYYQRFGLLKKIDGDQTIDEVTQEIAAKLAVKA